MVGHIKKDICGRCPVWSECLASAKIENDDEWGIRGGMTPPEREMFWSGKDVSPQKLKSMLSGESNQSLAEQLSWHPKLGQEKQP